MYQAQETVFKGQKMCQRQKRYAKDTHMDVVTLMLVLPEDLH